MAGTGTGIGDRKGDLTMKRKTTYDPGCFELAELFLADEPALRDRVGELAAHIQMAIEDWIAAEKE
jgi:hypothetical protein